MRTFGSARFKVGAADGPSAVIEAAPSLWEGWQWQTSFWGKIQGRGSACEKNNENLGTEGGSGALRDICAFAGVLSLFFRGIWESGGSGAGISV